MNTKKIRIFNNKGGVAKTTSVINIAYSLHKADKKVLVVDCDTQENCFDFFFLEKSDRNISTIKNSYGAFLKQLFVEIPYMIFSSLRSIKFISGSTVYFFSCAIVFPIERINKIKK